VDKDNLYLTY